MLRWRAGRLALCASLLLVMLLVIAALLQSSPASQRHMVRTVLRYGSQWRRNRTAASTFRKLLTDRCNSMRMFAVTKENSPVGKLLWYDGEYFYYHRVNDDTYSLFVKEPPLNFTLKTCAVVGNAGILKRSRCGSDIDQADFVMRSDLEEGCCGIYTPVWLCDSFPPIHVVCNLPPLSKEFTEDVGTRTNMVTANPSIIDNRFQSLLLSRKQFVESMKVYGSSYIYMPAFSMIIGTAPSMRACYALMDCNAPQTMLFAHPDFLKSVSSLWRGRGVQSKRLSTGLFLVSLALGLCEEVTLYGFWPFASGLDGRPVTNHYYDNVASYPGFHAMPEEFAQLWRLHENGVLRLRVHRCAKEEG